MLKKLYFTFLKRISHDWKTIIYCLIIGIIGFLAFIFVLHNLSNN